MTFQEHRAGRTWLLVLPLALSLAAHSQVSDAAEYLTALAGGSGGTAYTLRCPSDRVLAGIQGRAGSLVDRIGALCAQVDPLGRWVGSPRSGGSAGGSGGTAFTLTCPRDYAVSGFQGRASSLIDQLRIRCGRLTTGPKLASIGSILAGQAGGTGGNAFGSFDCADSKPGRGLSGRNGIYIDSMMLICDIPASPLRPSRAYLRDTSGLQQAVTRVVPRSYLIGSEVTAFYIFVSSPPLGEYRIPVSSSNTGVATIDTGAEMKDTSQEGRAYALLRAPGCTVLQAGYAGETPYRAELLVTTPQNPAFTLDLSLLVWSSTTTSAFGTLTLPSVAPAGGTVFTLRSSATTVASVPASVTIAAGSRTATFEMRRVGGAAACVIFSANGNGVTLQSPMLFRPVLQFISK